jgi:hypothetical protein
VREVAILPRFPSSLDSASRNLWSDDVVEPFASWAASLSIASAERTGGDGGGRRGAMNMSAGGCQYHKRGRWGPQNSLIIVVDDPTICPRGLARDGLVGKLNLRPLSSIVGGATRGRVIQLARCVCEAPFPI